MALVERVPHNPEAIDISAIQRREQLKIWNRRKEEIPHTRHAWWRWLGHS